MIEVTMYGQHTSAYEYIKMMLLQNTKKANVDLKITEINDWMEIVRQKVPSLPTIRVNNHIDMSYTQDQNINQYVHKLTTEILKEENYGAMTKIIVPTDFSDTATNALVYAHNLSRKVNGMIKLIHIYRPEVAHIDNLVVVDKEVEDAKRKELDDFVQKINQSWIGASNDYIPMEGIFKVGFAAEEIQSYVKEPYDEHLIVIGSTGSTNNLKKLFGSVSLQLIKSSPCPVLVVPPKSTYNGIRQILFTVDNFEKDKLACQSVLKWAEQQGATLHMLHVNTDGSSYPEEKMLEKCSINAPSVKTVFSEISGSEVITEMENYVYDHDIDLLAMTTYDRSFFKDLLHKSISKQMALHATIPLLIVHT